MVSVPPEDGVVAELPDHLLTDNSIAFAFTRQGASHTRSDRPCQDSSAVYTADSCVFICVADGHGGDDYIRSRDGSRLCCLAARECMTDYDVLVALTAADSVKEADKLLAQLKKSIICRWNELIALHLETNPFTEEELEPLNGRTADRYRAGEYTERAYGTTLLAAVYSDSFCLIIQLGDGKCVTMRDGEYHSLMPEDPKCQFNTTTSMCDSQAFSETRHCFFGDLRDIPEETGRDEPAEYEDSDGGFDDDGGEPFDMPDTDGRAAETGRYFRYLPEAVFLCTDGISNSFSDDGKLYDLYYAAIDNLCASADQTAGDGKAMESAMDELRDYISIISEKGSGDDVSLASIIIVR